MSEVDDLVVGLQFVDSYIRPVVSDSPEEPLRNLLALENPLDKEDKKEVVF